MKGVERGGAEAADGPPTSESCGKPDVVTRVRRNQTRVKQKDVKQKLFQIIVVLPRDAAATAAVAPAFYEILTTL